MSDTPKKSPTKKLLPRPGKKLPFEEAQALVMKKYAKTFERLAKR